MLAKGSAEFDGNQKDKERHSIVVTVNMPNLQLMDLILGYPGCLRVALANADSAGPFSVTIPEISRDFRLLHWEGVAQ